MGIHVSPILNPPHSPPHSIPQDFMQLVRPPGVLFLTYSSRNKGFPGGSDSKESARKAGDLGLIPGLGRSPGGARGNTLQYSCLENPMDRGAWWATVHGVA